MGCAAVLRRSPAGAARRFPVPAAEDEVRRLALTLNGMLARLDAAGARQRAFVADAAHELRSPLASLRTQLEVAQRHPDAADWREVTEDVLADAHRMARIVDDLLLLARLDEDRLTVGPTDLIALADEAVVRLGAGARVPLSRADAPGLKQVLVVGDTAALSRVISNLVENAVRHAATRVTVTVEGPVAGLATGPVAGLTTGSVTRSRRGEPGGAVLTVSDDGPGIAAADRERVFERFTRLDAARSRDEGGSGLGLAIVRGVVAGHGGTVTLADAGPGLRVVVQLPTERVIEAVIRTTVP
jgi:signal transduction histidine kinase